MYFIDYVLFLLKQLRLKLGKAKTAVEQAGKGLTNNITYDYLCIHS